MPRSTPRDAGTEATRITKSPYGSTITSRFKRALSLLTDWTASLRLVDAVEPRRRQSPEPARAPRPTSPQRVLLKPFSKQYATVELVQKPGYPGAALVVREPFLLSVNAQTRDRSLQLQTGQPLVLEFKSYPSTGYEWYIVSSIAHEVKSQKLPPRTPGAKGDAPKITRVFWAGAQLPGRFTIVARLENHADEISVGQQVQFKVSIGR